MLQGRVVPSAPKLPVVLSSADAPTGLAIGYLVCQRQLKGESRLVDTINEALFLFVEILGHQSILAAVETFNRGMRRAER